MPVPIYFRQSGSGPDMIILHGLFGSSDNWHSISKKLETHFRIFLPDLRNHGQSPHTDTHSYEDMTADLELFFQTNRLDKTIVMGHSMGGKLAMMFAAKHPEKIKHLIVADITPKQYTSDSSEDEDQEMLLTLMETLDFSLISTRKEIDEALSKKIRSISLRQFLIKNIYRNKEGKFGWKINVPVLRKYLPAIIHDVNENFFNDYKPITSYPVTFIRGLNSNYIQDKDLSLIKSIYPQSKIIDIPNAGHWLHAEQPEKFINAVLSSLL